MLAQSGQDLQRMNDTRNISEAGEQNVDQEVAVTTTFKEDADGWQEDSENDFADVAKMQTLSVRFRYGPRNLRSADSGVIQTKSSLDLRCCKRHCGGW